jgi:threonine/homoserine/homoserine lactone efflux protein
MTVGAAASFATLAQGPARLALTLGVTFGLCAAISLSLWCTAGLILARVLRSEIQWRVLNVPLGMLLAACILPIWL